MKHCPSPWCAVGLAVAGLTLVGCGSGDPEHSAAGATQVALAAQQTGPSTGPSAGPSTGPPTGSPSGPPPFPPIELGTAPPNPYSQAQIEQGRHLVDFGGCNDCHTPWMFDPELGIPVADMSRRLSGHPKGAPDASGTIGATDMALIGPTFTSFTQPFGTVYSANLTPDIDTGTGSWTEKMFIDIFRTGRHLGGSGRPVLPPMPWPNVASLSDQELVAIFAYLRSLQPVRNLVPSPNVPEPVMWAMRDSNDRILGLEPRQPGEVLAAK